MNICQGMCVSFMPQKTTLSGLGRNFCHWRSLNLHVHTFTCMGVCGCVSEMFMRNCVSVSPCECARGQSKRATVSENDLRSLAVSESVFFATRGKEASQPSFGMQQTCQGQVGCSHRVDTVPQNHTTTTISDPYKHTWRKYKQNGNEMTFYMRKWIASLIQQFESYF